MERKLKFIKMWEGANTYVLDIEPGSALAILHTVPKIASFADKDWLYFFEKGIGAAYYEEGGIKKAKMSGLKDFLDKDFQKKYFDGIENAMSQTQNFVNEVSSLNLKEISNDKLGELLKEGVDVNTELFGFYLACQPQYIAGIETKVQLMLSEETEDVLINEIYTLLSTPTKITTIRQEEIDWINLLLLFKKEGFLEASQARIQNHLKKYRTLHAADGGIVWDEKYLTARFEEDKNIPTNILELKMEEIQNSLDKIINDQKDVITKYHVSQEVVDICTLLANIGHTRLEMRINGWMPAQTYIEFIAEEIAIRNSYNPKKIKFAKTTEILDIIKGNLISKEILEDRSNNFLITILDGKMDIYGGEKAVTIFNQLVESEDHSKTKEIKGNIAMKGITTGTAVVFKWTDNMQEKISQMGENSVLVAGQTRPQLMPLILKAKAIVTDEGGITSHAAIVSRELGIPCIIGTKVATQVIKDGDTIEVDANNGVIKIIN